MHQSVPGSMGQQQMVQHPQATGYHTLQPTDPMQDDGRKQEIGDILQQIMTITDQSLDEAQARLVFTLG